MSITYGKSWFRAKQRITEVWDERRAREAHLSKQPYAAYFNTEECRYFVEMNGNSAAVGMLDLFGREYISYQFQEKELQRLFLTMAVHREFQDDTHVVLRGTILVFKPDGQVILEQEDFAKHTKLTGPAENAIDVSQNWEPYPSFGDYSSIARINRGF
jgi:hypothetical protein